MEKVLESTVIDVYAYLQYLDAKNKAEKIQYKFESELRKHKK